MVLIPCGVNVLNFMIQFFSIRSLRWAPFQYPMGGGCMYEVQDVNFYILDSIIGYGTNTALRESLFRLSESLHRSKSVMEIEKHHQCYCLTVFVCWHLLYYLILLCHQH